jgi:hypothetical protein
MVSPGSVRFYFAGQAGWTRSLVALSKARPVESISSPALGRLVAQFGSRPDGIAGSGAEPRGTHVISL